MTENSNSIADDPTISDFACGYNFGWQLSEDIQEKREAKTMTQDDILALGTMFKEFYEHAEKDNATPYERGFLEGVTEFSKTVEGRPKQNSAT